MTIKEAIDGINALKPNDYTNEEKISWLSTIDGLIYRNLVKTHENDDGIEFVPYTSETDLDTELIAYEPYCELYLLWLESKIDYYNSEQVKYNNAVTRFNDIYTKFGNDYNRNHMPLGSHFKYF